MEGLKEDYIMRRNRHILPNAYKELDVQIEDLEFDTTEEQNFYHSIKDTIKKEFLRAKAEDTNYMSTIFELLLRLRQATIHPSIVLNGLYRKYKEEDDDSIDLKVLENKIRYWNKRSSTKMNKLVEMFGKHNSTTKSIIFTHYTEESNMVYKCLQNSYGELRMEIFDGSLSIDKRNSMIKRAQNGEIDCLIVQILCGGVGLNLQMFNRVYIITPNWNPSNEIQAIARCHRIGQTENVVVVKLIIKEEDMKSTIDEKILVVQQEKRVLMAEHLNDSSLLFNEESVSGGLNLTMKDFQFLFK
jgi:SNF2 family DNA or RNA helicase